MVDGPFQEKTTGNEERAGGSDFRREIGVLLEQDGEIFSGYYDGEVEMGRPEEVIESQVCTRIGYETMVRNKVNKGEPEQLLIPIESSQSVVVCAPPVVPYVIDEFMPRDLWEIVKADDPSVEPPLEQLKCVEIGVYGRNTFKNGDVRKSGDIYRVDLTKEKPVLYKRYPIPKNKQGKRDALGTGDDAELVSVILDIVQPLPRYEYKQIDSKQLKLIIETIKGCREGSR